MATYEEIHGKRVETFSSDPTLDSSYEGQVWFNSTSGTLKTVVASDAFISGTPMPVGKSTYHRAGTMTAGLFCAGNASTGFTTSTEEWNGSGFSQGGAIGTALYSNTGFGTQTAGASAAGRPTNGSSGDTNATFEYDGSTWTSVNAANLAARTRQSFGIQTAAAMVGGFQQTTSTYTNATEEYDGTNWTTVTAMPVSAASANCMGTQTAAIVTASGAPTINTNVIAYDGTNWTSSPSMNIARARSAAGGTGATNTAGLVFGGVPYSPTASATAERWDGTSFSSSPASLSTARYGAGISDGNTNGIMVGGYQGTAFQSAVEEFNSSINTFTAAAWASAPALNTARGSIGSAGIQTAALAVSGEPPAPGGKVESYDGSSWTEGPALSTGRSQLGSVGTQTAALAFGGEPAMANTETWNGSSWTATPNSLNTAAKNMAAFGSQTAAVKAGGFGSPPSTYLSAVETWNGSAWTASPNSLPATNAQNRGFGTSTAGVNCAGLLSPGAVTGTTSEWDGSNWTTSGAMGTARSLVGTAGTQTDGLIAGGYTTANSLVVEGYDGTSWSTRPSLALARQAPGGLGTNSVSTAGLVCGGNIPPSNAATATVETFTGVTETINAKTLTTS